MSKKDLDIKGAINKATNNPAMAYISVPEPPKAEDNKLEQAIEEYKRRKEKKTKRVQVLFKTSVYAKVKAKADAEGMSFNEFIEVLINKNLKEND